MRNRVTAARAGLHLLLIAIGIGMILPLLWALSTSLKPTADIISTTPTLIPRRFSWEHYAKLATVAPLFRFFFNSVIIAVVSTLFVIVGSVTAGYVFAKYRSRWLNVLLICVIATILIPMESYLVPLYVTVLKLGWINSYIGMIYPTVIMSSGIFFLRQSMLSIPDDLIDAARIDGCGEFYVVSRVVAPLVTPALATVAILNWVFTWSLFIWPLVVASSDKLFPLEVGLMYFQRQHMVDYGGVMAATLASMAPVLLVFILFRRHIIQGIASTGMKG